MSADQFKVMTCFDNIENFVKLEIMRDRAKESPDIIVLDAG